MCPKIPSRSCGRHRAPACTGAPLEPDMDRAHDANHGRGVRGDCSAARPACYGPRCSVDSSAGTSLVLGLLALVIQLVVWGLFILEEIESDAAFRRLPGGEE
jgi:hypothetical protein